MKAHEAGNLTCRYGRIAGWAVSRTQLGVRGRCTGPRCAGQIDRQRGYSTAMTDLAIRCECGRLTGLATHVSPALVNRVVCHCRGCTAYAHVLGRPAEMLDERGGTDVFQMSPRQFTIDAGLENVACMRLSDRGALRWYARCCKTPIAHTLGSLRLPFMAIHHSCVSWPEAVDARTRIAGPIRARLNGRFSSSDALELRATTWATLSMLPHYSPLFFRWLVRGDARHSPFVDSNTGQPIVPAQRVRAHV